LAKKLNWKPPKLYFGLEQGYNPFEHEKKEFVEFKQDTQKTPDKVWSCIQAFNLFTHEWENRGLEEEIQIQETSLL